MTRTDCAIQISARDAVRQTGATLTVEVKVRRTWVVEVGLLIIRLGCWIAGVTYDA